MISIGIVKAHRRWAYVPRCADGQLQSELDLSEGSFDCIHHLLAQWEPWEFSFTKGSTIEGSACWQGTIRKERSTQSTNENEELGKFGIHAIITVHGTRKMAPRKRKTDEQPKLEDEQVSKSRKGDLAQTKKEAKAKHTADHDDEGDDLFLKRRARKTGVDEPAKSPSKEAVHKKEAAEDSKPSTGSDAGIW